MRPSLRVSLASALVLSTAASAAIAAPALANPASPAQPGSGYAGSTLRSHHSPAATGTANSSALPAIVNAPSRAVGVDVSSYQTGIDWGVQWRAGVRFAYVKATEGTSYRNPAFAAQYNGSYHAGMIRGAYHFGLPNVSAVAQANFFTANGGGWSRDGKTLPPALDIEYNPYGATCYGQSQSAMVKWLRSFANQVYKNTSRYPVIYTTTDWWRQCTGNSPALAKTDRIWIANWSGTPGILPAGWKGWKIWQYKEGNSQNPNDPDRNVFNGGWNALRNFALNKG